jgi:hypothetical protein
MSMLNLRSPHRFGNLRVIGRTFVQNGMAYMLLEVALSMEVLNPRPTSRRDLRYITFEKPGSK